MTRAATEKDLAALRNALAAWMRSQDVDPADGVVAMIDLAAAAFGTSIARQGMPRSECFECWEAVTCGGRKRLLMYYDEAVAARNSGT